ncbi:MAG TPA: hypothetical protein VGN81_15010 [Pseudonocardiaceae bacterium]
MTIGTAAASTSSWQENLATAQSGDVNVNRTSAEISIRNAGFGTALFASHQLATPTDRITVSAQDKQAEIDVRGMHNGQWTQWASPDSTGTAQLSSRVDSVQAKVTLRGNGAELTGLALTPAAAGAVKANAAQPAAAESYKVYATDEGLVGQETSNGHIIQPNDHFVALPSRSALSPQGSTSYSVQVCGPTRCETAPVWDTGPWNIQDDYWDAHRAEFTDLPQGEPEAQAAYQNGYNGGHDDEGGSPSNPAGIDLADGTFANIGLTDNGWVTVTYLWTSAPSTSSDDGTNASTVIAPNGHLYKFARGTDNTLRMWSSDFTTGWADKGANLGGSISGSPSAVIAPNGHMYIFAEGTDHTLRMWSSNFTSGWVDNDAVVVGGAVDGGSPNAVIAPNKHMYVFARGTDNNLRMWSSDFTTGWVDKGAVVAGGAVDGSAPNAVIAPNGHMYVFAQGTDNTLRMWSSDFTTGWVDKGAVVVGGAVDGSAPDAVIAPNGHMYVFARGTDNNLRMWSSDFTSGWVDQGAVVAGGAVAGSAPNAVIAPNGRMYVFARGTDDNLRMWSSDFTTGWVDKGAVVAGGAVEGAAPDAVIAPNNHLYVFARGTDNNLRMWSSDFTTGWVDKGAVVVGGAVDAS